MNPILIVLPILTLLMFDLGLTLQPADFLLFRRRPRAVAVGLVGQIVVLPAVAFALGMAFALPPVFFVGLVLIACSPGGDVALSVTLTALSSVITLLTIPPIMQLAVGVSGAEASDIHLPVGRLFVQNLLLMLLPIAAGICVRRWYLGMAAFLDHYLSRIAFPALILLAVLFFIQHWATITTHFTGLGACITLMILSATMVGAVLSRLMHLDRRETRTIVIEVGMQNAAQAIAVASSPLIFHNDVMAIPAILYALLMNVILLLYVAAVKRRG